MPRLQDLQIFLLKNKSEVINIFVMVELIIVLLIVTAPFLYSANEDLFFRLVPILGNRAGQLSFILYITTLTPGVLNRLRLLSTIRVILMSFRRHFGITMFLTAILHSFYTTLISLFSSGSLSLSVLNKHQVMGLSALLCLFPLWLTSNDYSMKKLGHFWSTLHRLTYLALFFMYVHVTLYGAKIMSYIGIAFIALEVISWSMYWRRNALAKRNLGQANRVNPKVQPTNQPPIEQTT